MSLRHSRPGPTPLVRAPMDGSPSSVHLYGQYTAGVKENPLSVVRPRRTKEGFIFLIGVLAVGVIAAATAASLLLLGGAAERTAFSVEESMQAMEFARACTERGILALRKDLSYSQRLAYTWPTGSCTLQKVDGNGYENRVLCVEGRAGSVVRRLLVQVERLYPQVSIASTKEIAEPCTEETAPLDNFSSSASSTPPTLSCTCDNVVDVGTPDGQICPSEEIIATFTCNADISSSAVTINGVSATVIGMQASAQFPVSSGEGTYNYDIRVNGSIKGYCGATVTACAVCGNGIREGTEGCDGADNPTPFPCTAECRIPNYCCNATSGCQEDYTGTCIGSPVLAMCESTCPSICSLSPSTTTAQVGAPVTLTLTCNNYGYPVPLVSAEVGGTNMNLTQGENTATLDVTSITAGSMTYTANATVDPLLGTYPALSARTTVTYIQCGNGIVEASEQCDDGNTTADDGCNASCQLEYYSCSTSTGLCSIGLTPSSYSFTAATKATVAANCASTCYRCGDGVRQGSEQCDDGNTSNNDTCLNTCQNAWCGDGFQQGTEQCDNGTNNTMIYVCPYGVTSCTMCSTMCTLQQGTTSYCGDGYMDYLHGEFCDDGNTNDGDGCSSHCLLEGYTCGSCGTYHEVSSWIFNFSDAASCENYCPECGDGVKGTYEECDDGNTTSGDGCSGTCRTEAYCCDSTAKVCGGSMIAVDDCSSGLTNTNQADCNTECALCGNGIVDAGEECDDGDTIDNNSCSNSCLLPVCGDGIVSGSEQCDTRWETYYCNANCTTALCGDGITNHVRGEQCDDGNLVSSDGCDSQCRTEALCCNVTTGDCDVTLSSSCNTTPYPFTSADKASVQTTCNAACPQCGDSSKEGFEQCDDGNTTSGDGCSSTCQTEVYCCGSCNVSRPPDQCYWYDATPQACSNLCPQCGDGLVSGSEQCDDGNITSGDGCSSACQTEVYCCDRTSGTCNTRVPAWSCTTGVYNASQATCVSSCSKCGDSIVDISFGEQCDDGNAVNTDGCTNGCMLPRCGDSIVNGTDTCDPGWETAACDNDCTAVACGDGHLNTLAGEQCDDGNAVNGDGCSSLCKNEVYCCDIGSGLCPTRMAQDSCTTGIFNANQTTCIAACNITVHADFCPGNLVCYGHPGRNDSTYCTNPPPSTQWDPNWGCPLSVSDPGPLGDGNYTRCIGAYKCACQMGGGEQNIAAFLQCFPQGSHDTTLLNSCLASSCQP